MQSATRRDFLGNLGHGMLVACVGPGLASEFSARAAPRDMRVRRLSSDLERLVRTMQDTAPDALMPVLVRELKNGTALRTLVGAGALANARTFGGHDYIGYHAQMALLPAHSMSLLMPEKLRALPVLKVLYRNSARIQAAGQGRERLQSVAPSTVDGDAAQALRQHVRDRAMQEAETLFRGRCDHDVAAAYDDLQTLIRDDLNVHRTVLAWRAFDMLQLLGEEHAHTMLRQFHTAREEFARTRPSMRWRHLVSLARVTASEYGEPAPGHALSRELLEG